MQPGIPDGIAVQAWRTFFWRRTVDFHRRSAPWGPVWGRFRDLLPRRQKRSDNFGASARLPRFLQPKEKNLPRGYGFRILGEGAAITPRTAENLRKVFLRSPPRILAYHLGNSGLRRHSDFSGKWRRASGDRLWSPGRTKGEVDRRRPSYRSRGGRKNGKRETSSSLRHNGGIQPRTYGAPEGIFAPAC